MKKIIYFILIITVSNFIFTSCEKDEKVEVPQVEMKKLTPTKVEVIENGETTIENPVKEGVISLEQGKHYRINITFSEDVNLVKGEFLKFKEKNKKEYYADFYGRNLKAIVENISFQKEGYEDWKLSIKQDIVIPNKYIHLETLGRTNSNSILKDKEGKIVWLTNTVPLALSGWYGEEAFNIKLSMSFAAPVYLEEVLDTEGNKLVSIDNNEDNMSYALSISTKELRTNTAHDYSFTMPLFENNNGEKGKQLGEITFIGNYAPFISFYKINRSFKREASSVLKVAKGSAGEIKLMKFSLQGSDADAFLDNLNTEYFEDAVFDGESKSWSLKVKEDKINTPTEGKVKAFELYEGQYADGVMSKKEGANQKREVFLIIE